MIPAVIAVAIGWSVMLLAAVVLLRSWTQQTTGYIVPMWHGRDRSVLAMMAGVAAFAVVTAMLWPNMATVGLAVGVVAIGLAPELWRRHRNRGHPDPRAGRSQTQRWSQAGRLIYSVGFVGTMTLLGSHNDAYPWTFRVLTLMFSAIALICVAVLVAKPERCPEVTAPERSTPGWYLDLCFDGRRFWNGSRWFDTPGRSRKYRMVGLYWLAWSVPLLLFGWLAGQEQVGPALAVAGIVSGILIGGGLVLTLHPLPRSPREDVPPVLPPLQPAFAGWFPAPAEAGDGSPVGQLRWWDGAAWTDWTYSADRL